jgi:hypothetical protein
MDRMEAMDSVVAEALDLDVVRDEGSMAIFQTFSDSSFSDFLKNLKHKP